MTDSSILSLSRFLFIAIFAADNKHRDENNQQKRNHPQ